MNHRALHNTPSILLKQKRLTAIEKLQALPFKSKRMDQCFFFILQMRKLRLTEGAEIGHEIEFSVCFLWALSHDCMVLSKPLNKNVWRQKLRRWLSYQSTKHWAAETAVYHLQVLEPKPSRSNVCLTRLVLSAGLERSLLHVSAQILLVVGVLGYALALDPPPPSVRSCSHGICPHTTKPLYEHQGCWLGVHTTPGLHHSWLHLQQLF